MKTLLVEDDQFKARHLAKALGDLKLGLEIEHARSVSSSLRILEERNDFDLVILDMSLPTFDVGPREEGGRPQGFGGKEIMAYMQGADCRTPVILVTQFERFGEPGQEIDLATLAKQLTDRFPAIFRGVVYYNATSDRWKEELASMVHQLRATIEQDRHGDKA